MKQKTLFICVLAFSLLFSAVATAAIPANCEEKRKTEDWPLHYCECYYNFTGIG
jgi:hypothetical protein